MAKSPKSPKSKTKSPSQRGRKPPNSPKSKTKGSSTEKVPKPDAETTAIIIGALGPIVIAGVEILAKYLDEKRSRPEAPKAPEEPEEPEEPEGHSLKDRLQGLDDEKEKGVITDEEYKYHRGKILEQMFRTFG